MVYCIDAPLLHYTLFSVTCLHCIKTVVGNLLVAIQSHINFQEKDSVQINWEAKINCLENYVKLVVNLIDQPLVYITTNVGFHEVIECWL